MILARGNGVKQESAFLMIIRIQTATTALLEKSVLKSSLGIYYFFNIKCFHLKMYVDVLHEK